ncbi:MAG: hypothetical protein CMJ64_18535 [Planctomycetaceae bacterium]|nr:hypothetical protein [Planctomycetaceae bacterium]
MAAGRSVLRGNRARDLLVGWTFASLGATGILLRPWLFLTLVFAGIGIPLSVPFIFPHPIPATVIWALQVGYISAIIGGTLFAFVMSYRMKLIGTRRIATSAALCALLAVGAILVLNFDPASSLTYRAMQLSNCVLPFTALAAAPLAVWWNRHR